jgi:hypothetical protein
LQQSWELRDKSTVLFSWNKLLSVLLQKLGYVFKCEMKVVQSKLRMFQEIVTKLSTQLTRSSFHRQNHLSPSHYWNRSGLSQFGAVPGAVQIRGCPDFLSCLVSQVVLAVVKTKNQALFHGCCSRANTFVCWHLAPVI